MRTLLSAGLFVLLVSGAAWAQPYEISVSAGIPRWGGAALGSSSPESPKDDDTKIKGEIGYGARITLNSKGYYGHEFGYIRNRATLEAKLRTEKGGEVVKQDRINTWQAFYNFVIYFMPRGERWRPFMTGGLGMHRYGNPSFVEWTGDSTRNYGFNYGGGLKIKLFNHALLRLDVRDHIGGKPFDLQFKDNQFSGGLMHQLETSGGISITF